METSRPREVSTTARLMNGSKNQKVQLESD